MIVLRKTMDAAIAAERERASRERFAFYSQYGAALERVEGLQRQLSAWVMNKADNITPEQMAAMFYEQDNEWQAAFFNSLQGVVLAAYDASPKSYWTSPGVPAGERQWCYMADGLNDSGFETLEAMFDHAKYVRENRAASVDTRPEGGDATEIAAPFTSGAVTSDSSADAQDRS